MRSVLLLCLLAGSAWAADVAAFNGRWNITVEGVRRVWWLKITDAGTEKVRGEFVGAPGGGLDRIPELLIRDGELHFAFRRHYRGEDREAKQAGYYTARVAGDKLEGTHRVEGEDKVTRWTGVRAPEFSDDGKGKWVEGKAIELFNGRDVTGWHPTHPERGFDWVARDGVLKNVKATSDIATDQKFWNFKLRVEYRVGEHSNAGVGLRGRYEVQVLDDYGQPASDKGNGAIYSRIKPLRNVSKRPGEWQTFDVTLVGRRVRVVHNGVETIPEQEIEGFTAIATEANEGAPGPIVIQGDHGSVEYRKITLIPLERAAT